jgi:hypothetical protein
VVIVVDDWLFLTIYLGTISPMFDTLPGVLPLIVVANSDFTLGIQRTLTQNELRF